MRAKREAGFPERPCIRSHQETRSAATKSRTRRPLVGQEFDIALERDPIAHFTNVSLKQRTNSLLKRISLDALTSTDRIPTLPSSHERND